MMVVGTVPALPGPVIVRVVGDAQDCPLASVIVCGVLKSGPNVIVSGPARPLARSILQMRPRRAAMAGRCCCGLRPRRAIGTWAATSTSNSTLASALWMRVGEVLQLAVVVVTTTRHPR